MSIVLQPRDFDVLRSLVVAVRLLTLRQVAQLRNADVANSRRRMAKLADIGLVAAMRIFAQGVPNISKPLCVWSRGEELPHAGKVSYVAKKRYKNKSPRHMTAYVATNRTLNLFGVAVKRGGPNRAAIRFKHHQATHEIGLAAVYVEHRHRWPKNSWVGEDGFERKWGVKKEDAFILGPERDIDKPLFAIDYLCKYPPSRIIALSRDLADRNLPFEFY